MYKGFREMIAKTSILLIQDDIKTLSELTEKCLEAGICEKNIFSVTESESAERYLEIAGISYVIIDADLYNFVIANTINKFSEYFPIEVIITNAKPEQKTLRMLTDKNLTFLNETDDLTDIIPGRASNIVSYQYRQNSTL